jgi:hypothetical protein
MQQITAAQFLSAIQKNAQRVKEYSLGCDGSGGKCDCIGLIIGALRLAGLKWTGTHGSNWAARNAVTDLHRIDSAGSLIPGMVVFKVREPGDEKYALPAAYDGSPDRLDYYHVGVVTSVNPLRITHCTGVAGGIKVDTSLGAWRYAAKLKQVDYEQEERPMDVLYEATVYADNGLPVRMRNQPSTNGKVVEQIPCGAVVDVLEEINDDWARISDQGVEGCMMRKFLRPVGDQGGGQDVPGVEIVTVTRQELKEAQVCLANALRIINKALGE